MKVIWKRPDGFHNAQPTDFQVVAIGNELNIWLHKKDQKNFPFRVSGGWQDENETMKLNGLINLLNEDSNAWQLFLKDLFNNSKTESVAEFSEELTSWLHQLRKNLKGDTWEIEIMSTALEEVLKRLNDNIKTIE